MSRSTPSTAAAGSRIAGPACARANSRCYGSSPISRANASPGGNCWPGCGASIFEPKTNSVAVHVARVRSKFEPFGRARLIGTHPEGRYVLDAPPAAGLSRLAGLASG